MTVVTDDMVTRLWQFATELIKQTAEKYGLPLKMSYNTVRGFHVQLCSTGKEGYSTDSLPDEFIKVTRCKNVFSFTTADLVCSVR